jgi:hypothetical protein
MDKKKHHSVCNCFDHRLLVPAALVQYLSVDTDFHLLMNHDHQPILLHPDALSLWLHNANIEAPLPSLLLDVHCTCMCSWIMVLLLMYLKWLICALAFFFETTHWHLLTVVAGEPGLFKGQRQWLKLLQWSMLPFLNVQGGQASEW